MSAEVDFPWRSIGCGQTSNLTKNNLADQQTATPPPSRSPSLSSLPSLPPLPDLIPIRKGVSIKNIEKLRNLQPQPNDYTNNGNGISLDGTSTSLTVQESLSCSRNSSSIFVDSSVNGESCNNDDINDRTAKDDNASKDNAVVVVVDDDDDDEDEQNDGDVEKQKENINISDKTNETGNNVECAESKLDSLSNTPSDTPTPIPPCIISVNKLCQINENTLLHDHECNILPLSNNEIPINKETTDEVQLPAKRTRSCRTRVAPARRTCQIRQNETKELYALSLNYHKQQLENRRKSISRARKKGNIVKKTQRKTNNSKKNSDKSKPVSRVNPIFLFAKQQDTRIVEVRCEDFDKRNRIRLTKTANGWRSIPRTDSSSTKVSTLLPKVIVTKRERDEADYATTPEQVNQNWRFNPFAIKPNLNNNNNNSWSQIVLKQEKIDPQLQLTSSGEQQHSDDYNSSTHNSHKKKKNKKKKKKRRKDKEQQKLEKQQLLLLEQHPQPQQQKRMCDNIVIVKTKQEPINSPSDNNTDTFSTRPNKFILSSILRQGKMEKSEEKADEQQEMEKTQSLRTENSAQMQPITTPLITNLLAIAQLEYNRHDGNDDGERTTSLNAFAPTEKTIASQSPSSVQYLSSTIEENATRHVEVHCEKGDGNIKLDVSSVDDDVSAKFEYEKIDDEIEICRNISAAVDKVNNNLIDPDRDDAPSVFETYVSPKSVCSVAHSVDSVHENQFIDNEEVGEYNDLIEGIPHIQVSHSEDILDNCGDNTMTGAELLDSLVERSCEDNHISGEEDIKHTICLSDDYNDDDDILMESQPVVDIISRLGDSLGSSPKCLSFNEAGEIEGLHESLFDNSHNTTDLTTSDDTLSNNLTPFNRTALEELSMTLKDLEKHSDSEQPVESSTIVSPDSCQEELPKDLSFKKNNEALQIIRHRSSPRPISRDSDAIQSPQPSGLPAVPPSPDILLHQPHKNLNKPLFLDLSSPSPKPSSEQRHEKTAFMDLTSPLPTPTPSEKRVQQKEPLDLGTHRKSASPTVSCSEEAKRCHDASEAETPLPKRIKSEHSNKSSTSNDLLMNSKTSQLVEMLASGKDPDPLTQLRLLISNPEWKLPDPILVPKDRLNAVLASPAREIPLLLTTRPELRLPDAFAFPSILQDPDILVISFSQLETILQKQDDLMKSSKEQQMNHQQQQEQEQQMIHQQQQQSKNDKKNSEKSQESPRSRSHNEKLQPKQSPNPISSQITSPMGPLLANGLAGDIDAATMAAFNQMLWLPYLGQMGQLNPEVLKAMSGLTSPNIPDPLQFAAATANQNRFSGFPSTTPPINYTNPLEFALWQEALAQANNVNMQRVMKLNADRESVQHHSKKSTAESKPQIQQTSRQQHHNNQSAYHQLQQQQQMQQQTNHNQKIGQMINPLNQMAMSQFFPPNLSNNNSNNRYYGGNSTTTNMQHQQQQQQPHHQLSNLSQYSPGGYNSRQSSTSQQQQHNSDQRSSQMCMQPPALNSKQSHSLGHSIGSPINPFYPNSMTNLQDYNSSSSSSSSGSSSSSSSRSKLRKEMQQLQQQQQQLQLQQFQQHTQQQQQQFQHQLQQHHSQDTKPRVTCKSLMNLLQPDLVQDPFATIKHHSTDILGNSKLSNLMAMPTFDLTSPPVSTTTTPNLNTMSSHLHLNSNDHHLQQQQQHQHQQQQHQQQQQQHMQYQQQSQPKLKVKPGLHLLDPLAMQRRLLNADEVPEVGSTTNGIEEMLLPNASLYHPLLNAQKSYTSPWQWTTVTATGE